MGRVGVGTRSAGGHVDGHSATLTATDLGIAQGNSATAIWCAETATGAKVTGCRGVGRVGDIDVTRHRWQDVGERQARYWRCTGVGNGEGNRTDATRPNCAWGKYLA